MRRRSLFKLRVAYTKLWQAGRRGDLSAAREAVRSVEEALAAQPAGGVPQLAEHRVAALTTVGVVELWTGEVADAVRHLDEARELAPNRTPLPGDRYRPWGWRCG